MATDDREGWWPEEEDEGSGESEPSAGPREKGPPNRPPRGLESRDRPKIRSRYSLFVGLAFIVLIAVAVLNAVGTDEGGSAGFGDDGGRALAEFAVPDARTGPVDADANIAQDDCATGRVPCPRGDRRLPACEIETPGAIRICDLFDKPLALSFWFTRGGDCLPSQDSFDRVAAQRSEEVNFLSVNVLDDRERVREIIDARGWTVPVGHDADGAVSNVYLIGVCPTLLLAYPGGVLHRSEIASSEDPFTVSEIDSLVDDLVEASAEREADALAEAGTEREPAGGREGRG
ncbi:MAG: TlpA family protein disulfide reductase [Solirubrobacterales bacterium]